MSAILDIVGSFIVGGLLLMMILSVNGNVSQYSIENGLELSAQEGLVEFVEEIENDFRRIGYHVSNPSTAITDCDSTSITFSSDIDNNGTVEVVSYSSGTTDQVGGTQNPRDFPLTRQVGEQQVSNSLGLTQFQLRFYDASGSQTWTPAAIKSIEIILQVESPFPVENTYAQANWTGKIYPRNLQ